MAAKNGPGMTIYVVESLGGNRAYLARALAAEGMRVVGVQHVDEVRAAQLVVLAAPAADDDVLTSISSVRLRHPDTIVVVATDRDSLPERLACYEAGADDCLFRPFSLDEMAAKLRALQRRRAGGLAMTLLTNGDAVVDYGSLELKVGEKSQSLTKREAELLAILARAEGEPVGRERVLREAWGAPAWMTNNSVDVYVGYVRRKLDLLSANVTVKTVRGLGFQLVRRKTRNSSLEDRPVLVGRS